MAALNTDRSAPNPNSRGVMWMVLAMALFSLEDALFKQASQTLPSGEAILLFGAGGALIFWSAMRLRGEPVLAGIQPSVMRLRLVLEVVGRCFYFLALALTPLSATTAILQATPLVVVLGAALIFGERVSLFRWLAIIAGLMGVLIILRPNSDDFLVLSLLAVVGMLGFACRDLASRAAPVSLSAFALGFYGFVAVIIAGGLVSVWEDTPLVWPPLISFLLLIGAMVVGVIAYISLMKAMRTGEVSAVTPFRYSRLLFGVTLGYVLFGESLSPNFWVGSAVVITSGLFIMRSRR